MSDLFKIVLTASLTLGGGVILLVLTQFLTRCQERKSVQAAVRSEIQSILAIVERRQYIRVLSNFIETIKKDGSVRFFQIRVGKDYDLVFRTNCNKLGLLPSETAAKTVRFYHLISSVTQDINLFTELPESPGLRESYGLDTHKGCVAFQEQTLQLSIETFDLGTELIQELALEFPMKRTLLAVGIAVLISTLCIPCSGIATYGVPFFNDYCDDDRIIWARFVLQTMFAAIAAAVIVNLFPRRPKP